MQVSLARSRPIAVPLNSVVITHRPAVGSPSQIFWVVLVRGDASKRCLWTGVSYDDAIRYAHGWVSARLTTQPTLAGWGVVDIVGCEQ